MSEVLKGMPFSIEDSKRMEKLNVPPKHKEVSDKIYKLLKDLKQKELEEYLATLKKELYVDMDGTLVDFISQINKYGYWRKNKTNKVDWDKVIAGGPKFWAEMDWMPSAKEAFAKLQEYAAQGFFELYILSSIDFDEGQEGKKMWIKIHTDFPIENVIFVQEPEDKAFFADSKAWLIDDRKKSLEPFSERGNIIEFTGDWNRTLEEVMKYLGKKV